MAEEKTFHSNTSGFGAALRAAREAADISLGDMTVRCRLSVAQLRALEEERMEDLPEPVYVRAFIRGYAQALGLDPKPLQDDYTARYGSGRLGSGQISIGQVPQGRPDDELVINAAGRGRKLRIAGLAVLIVVLAAGTASFLTDRFGSDEPAEPVVERVTQAPAEPAPAAQAEAPAAPAAPAAPEEVKTVEVPQTAARAPEPAKAEPQAPAPEGTHSVLLITTKPCWVQVTGPDGTRIIAREMQPGERLRENIPKDSRFTIGNPSSLTIAVDGENYDYSNMSRGGVARFVLR